jgi:tight adherence protein C
MSIVSLAASAVVLGVALGTGLCWSSDDFRGGRRPRRVASRRICATSPIRSASPARRAAVTSSWRLCETAWPPPGWHSEEEEVSRVACARRGGVRMSWPFVPGSSDGLWGARAGGLLVVALTLLGRGGPTLAVLPPLFAAAGVLGCDYRLTRAARQRIARVEEELPTVLEFLAVPGCR